MNINFHAPINWTGYGLASLNIYKSLSKKQDNNISLFPIGGIHIDNHEDAKIIDIGIKNQTSFQYDAPCVKIWHQFDLAGKIGNGKYFAYPFFELTLFNDREKHHLQFPDHLIVSSEWAKTILLNNKIDKPISVVPLGVDRTIFNEELYANNSIPDKYIFITVGKWEKRKSHDIIIELFNQAFEPSDNVELWMVTNNPFLSEEKTDAWHNLAMNTKMGRKIKLFPRIETQSGLAELISYASCGIYISRSEGWNLDMLETMSLNKPVITTNYSAHTEFCNKSNSLLVEIDELEDADDGIWFHGLGQWARIGESQKEQTIHYMREVYKNRTTTNVHGIETAKIFSWENSADKLLRCIAN